MTHICVGKTTFIGSDNGLSPTWLPPSHYLNQCWNIVNWTLRTNFGKVLIEYRSFSFKKMHLKMSSGEWRPSCLGLNVLTRIFEHGFWLAGSNWPGTTSIPWLLMPWLHASPGHQQPWYWLHTIIRFLLSQVMISTACAILVSWNYRTCKCIFVFPETIQLVKS